VAQEVRRVGFIGLGDIGLPMAKRVAVGGYEVTVCGHVRREPVEEMKKLGAKEVKTPKEVAQASNVTIIMLRDDVDTGEVVLGSGGVLEGAKEGTGIILMNTLSPAFCRRVGEAAKAKNVDVLDAPVVGRLLARRAEDDMRAAYPLGMEPNVRPPRPADELVVLLVASAHDDLQSRNRGEPPRELLGGIRPAGRLSGTGVPRRHITERADILDCREDFAFLPDAVETLLERCDPLHGDASGGS